MKKIKFKKKYIFILLGVALCLSLCFGTSLGRFIYNEIKSVYFNSKNFYFESDKLNVTMSEYAVSNWNGVDTHSIIINMNSMKNNLAKADTDVTYVVNFSCSDNVSCDSSKSYGVIYSDTNTDYFVITLTPNTTLHDGDTVWMEVIVTSTSPYTKTLEGRFTLTVGYYGLSYEIAEDENDVYIDLNITNTLDYYEVLSDFGTYHVGDHIDIDTYLALTPEEQSHCASSIITLQFDPNLVLLDMTSTVYLNALTTETTPLNGYDYINKISFKIDAVSSQVVKFYKVDPTQDYTYPNGSNPSVITVEFS